MPTFLSPIRWGSLCPSLLTSLARAQASPHNSLWTIPKVPQGPQTQTLQPFSMLSPRTCRIVTSSLPPLCPQHHLSFYCCLMEYHNQKQLGKEKDLFPFTTLRLGSNSRQERKETMGECCLLTVTSWVCSPEPPVQGWHPHTQWAEPSRINH